MHFLTDALVAALPVDGRDRPYADSKLAGFAVRVTPQGAKIFQARARVGVGGPRRTVPLGTFPDLSVAAARSNALRALADMRRGVDPVLAERTRQRAALAGEVTVAGLAAKWMADHVRPKLKPRTILDYDALLAKHILPALGHLSVAAVERDDVIRLHVAMQATPRRANYTISTVRALLNFAIDLKLRPPASNPVRRIKAYRERKLERFLTEIEIARAAEAITAAEATGRIGPCAASGLRLALLTGARSGELTAAQWAHVDWQRKIIRLPDSKTNEPRTIHLSEAAVEVLRATPRVGPFIVAGVNPGEPYKNLGRAWIKVRALAGLGDVRLHDLRHSFASVAAAQGMSLQMIGKLLGHRVPATTQRYAHLARDAVADASDAVGAVMAAAIEKGVPQPASVVKLPRRRRRRG
jgi:integrase